MQQSAILQENVLMYNLVSLFVFLERRTKPRKCMQLKCSGMLRRVHWSVFTDVALKLSTSISLRVIKRQVETP